MVNDSNNSRISQTSFGSNLPDKCGENKDIIPLRRGNRLYANLRDMRLVERFIYENDIKIRSYVQYGTIFIHIYKWYYV